MTILLATLLATSLVAHLIHFLVFRNKFFLVRQSFIDEIDRLRRSLNTTKTSNLKEVSSAYKSPESKDQEIQRLKDALQKRAENELRRISESSKDLDALKVLTNDLKLKAICASDLYNVELEKQKSLYDNLLTDYRDLDTRYLKGLHQIKDLEATNLELTNECASKIQDLESVLVAKDDEYEGLASKYRVFESQAYQEIEKHKATIETLQNNFASYKAEKEAKIDKLNEELTAANLNKSNSPFSDLLTNDVLRSIDLEAKDKEIERLTELVGSYKLVSDEVSKADTDRRNKVNSLINYTSMGGLTKTETIAKLQALI